MFFYEVNDRGYVQSNLRSELCDYMFVSHVLLWGYLVGGKIASSKVIHFFILRLNVHSFDLLPEYSLYIRRTQVS